MRDNFVIVYNEHDRTAYIREDANGIPGTTRTVVHATVYDTWDDAMDKIIKMREHNDNLGFKSGMFFPVSVNKKDIFKAKLKGR